MVSLICTEINVYNFLQNYSEVDRFILLNLLNEEIDVRRLKEIQNALTSRL